MSSVAFIVNIVFSCLITLFFLYRCGNYRRQHPITTAAVFIAWFFSVLIVFILPLDISLVRWKTISSTCSTYLSFKAVYRDCVLHLPATIPTPSPSTSNSSTTVKIVCSRRGRSAGRGFLGRSMSSSMVLHRSDRLQDSMACCSLDFTSSHLVRTYGWTCSRWIVALFSRLILPVMQSICETGWRRWNSVCQAIDICF